MRRVRVTDPYRGVEQAGKQSLIGKALDLDLDRLREDRIRALAKIGENVLVMRMSVEPGAQCILRMRDASETDVIAGIGVDDERGASVAEDAESVESWAEFLA